MNDDGEMEDVDDENILLSCAGYRCPMRKTCLWWSVTLKDVNPKEGWVFAMFADEPYYEKDGKIVCDEYVY